MIIAIRRVAAILIPFALLAGCSVVPEDAPAQIVRGPLSSRPQQPIFLTNLAMRPRRAVTQLQGTWAAELELAHSSLFEVRSGDGARAAFDGEVSRAAVRTFYGLGPDTDLLLEIAAVYGSSGFLDHFIDSFHEQLLLPDGGRDAAEENQYEMELRRDGVTAFALEEDQVLLADAPLVITHRVREATGGDPTIAVRAGVDLPLGSEERGSGNGALDWGVGVLGEHLVGRWSFFWGLDVIAGAESDAFEEAGIEVLEQLHAHAGAEVRWTDEASLFLQLAWTGPITDSIDLEEIDREILGIGVGCAWDVGAGGRLRFSFHEDIVAATGSDLSVFLGIGWGF